MVIHKTAADYAAEKDLCQGSLFNPEDFLEPQLTKEDVVDIVWSVLFVLWCMLVVILLAIIATREVFLWVTS